MFNLAATLTGRRFGWNVAVPILTQVSYLKRQQQTKPSKPQFVFQENYFQLSCNIVIMLSRPLMQNNRTLSLYYSQSISQHNRPRPQAMGVVLSSKDFRSLLRGSSAELASSLSDCLLPFTREWVLSALWACLPTCYAINWLLLTINCSSYKSSVEKFEYSSMVACLVRWLAGRTQVRADNLIATS